MVVARSSGYVYAEGVVEVGGGFSIEETPRRRHIFYYIQMQVCAIVNAIFFYSIKHDTDEWKKLLKILYKCEQRMRFERDASEGMQRVRIKCAYAFKVLFW